MSLVLHFENQMRERLFANNALLNFIASGILQTMLDLRQQPGGVRKCFLKQNQLLSRGQNVEDKEASTS